METTIALSAQDIIKEKEAAFNEIKSQIESLIKAFEKENNCEVIAHSKEGNIQYTLSFEMGVIDRELHLRSAV